MSTSDQATARQSPSRRVQRVTALVFAALIAGPAFGAVMPPAEAQGQITFAVIVESVSFSENPAIGIPTTMTVVVRNVGASVAPGTPVRIHAFWNLSDYNGPSQPGRYNWLAQTPDTDVQDEQDSTRLDLQGIPNGQTRTYTFQWTPDRQQPSVANGGPQAGAGKVIILVRNEANNAGQDANDPRVRKEQLVVVRNPRFDLNPMFRWDAQEITKIKNKCIGTPYPVGTGGADSRPCKIDPGQLVIFKLNVSNRGNFEDTYNFTWADSGGGQPVSTFRWNISITPKEVRVAPGKTREVLLLMEPPRTGQTGEAGWTINGANTPVVEAIAKSLTNTAINHRTAFPRLIVTQFYDVNITNPQRVRIANVTQDMAHNFTLNNNGNGDDRFEFKVLYPEGTIDRNWNASILPTTMSANGEWNVTRELDPRSFLNLSLNLQPPPTTTKGLYYSTILVRSQNATGDVSFKQTFRTDVQQRYALAKEEGVPVQRLPAAKTASFPFVIKNEGNGVDDVRLRLENVPFGWTAKMSATRLTIPAFGQRDVWMNLTSPVAAREGTAATVFINATSSGPVNETELARPNVSFNMRTEVLRAPNLVLAPRSAQNAFVDPNGTARFEVRVSNLGNVWDNVSFQSEQPLEWEASIEPSVLTLPPRGVGVFEKSAFFTIKAPNGAAIGDQAAIILRALSEADAGQRRELSYTARVSGPDLQVGTVTHSKAPRPIYEKELVFVNATVSNGGNKETPTNVTVRFIRASAGVEILLAEQVLPKLRPGASQVLSIPWNTTDAQGAGTFIVRVDPAGEITEIDETNNVASLGGESAYVRTWDLRVNPAVGLSGRPGERVDYQGAPNWFTIANFGDRRESITYRLASQNGWAPTRTETVSLQEGEERVVAFDVTIPPRPGTGDDLVTLVVDPANRPSFKRIVSVTTTVVDRDAPAISNVRVSPSETTLGGRVNFTATVTDAVGLASVTAFVRSPLGGTEAVALSRGRGDTFYAERAFSNAGEYSFYVEAVDRTAAANRADTRTTDTKFKILPGSAPVITVQTDLEKPVRAGAVIAMSITDPLGIARAYYVIGTDEFPLPRTWELDTTPFSSGLIDLTVFAENVFGVRSSKQISFTVDNTPPNVRDFTIEPEKPKAGEEVTLRVVADDDVTGVDVVVKRGGETIETVPALSQGGGVFVLRYTPLAGDHTFDVIAKDEAGNTKVSEGAVTFTARTGLFAPGLEALAVLAGLGAVAFFRRRRG